MSGLAVRLYRNLVLHRPRTWLFIIVAISLLAGFHARDFHLDASTDSLIMQDDPALEYYRQVAQRYGGSGDILIATYTPNQGSLFNRTTLNRISKLEARLKQVPNVASAYSLLDVPLLFSPPQSFQELAGGTRTLRDPSVDPATTRKEFTETNPIYKNLLTSTDGRTAAILLTLKDNPRGEKLLHQRTALREKQEQTGLSEAEEAKLESISAAYSRYQTHQQAELAQNIAEIRKIMDSYEDQANLFLGGVPMIASDMIRFIAHDLKVFGGGVLAFLVVLLFVFFRQPRWVVIPLLCCSLSTLWVVGWLGWVNWKVTVISSNFIALLLIIDISVTIYLIVRYRELQVQFPKADKRWLVEQACLLMIRPCLCMVLAAMVGFGSLVVSGIRPVIDFGWMMAIGVGVSLPVCYTLFPSLVQLLPDRRPGDLKDLTQAFTHHTGNITERWIWIPPIAGAILVGLIAWGSSQLTVENRFIDYFRESTEIYKGMRQIDLKLGGTTPLDIVIEAPKQATGPAPSSEPQNNSTGGSGWGSGKADPFADSANDGGDPFASGSPPSDPFGDNLSGGNEDSGSSYKNGYWFTPQHLEKLVRIQHYVESLPATGKVLSIASTYELAKKINQGPLSYVQLMLLSSFIPADLRDKLIQPYISASGNEVRIMVRVIDSTENLNRNLLLKKIRHDLTTQFELQPEQVHLTGAMVLYNNMLQSLFDSQIKTLGLVLVMIFVILMVLFRSFKMAFIAILPNTISATSVLGLLGFIGHPLDLMTITITSITIGLAVNDSIHYIYRFYEEFPKDRNYMATMHRCHDSICTAMCYTSTMIVLGFSILVFSNFTPTIAFGLLTGLAILVALAANLTLLPALMILLKPKIPEKAIKPPEQWEG